MSEATGSATKEDLALADRSAELTDKGEAQCLKAAALLRTEYRLTISHTKVALSEFVRTQQTAKLVGFQDVLTTIYPQLNEVKYGMKLAVLRALLRDNKIPSIAPRAAEALLRSAPPEGVWITHGLLIAGMCTLLGVADQYERPVPRQCEVRRLTF